jgi:hypothetical protein
LASLLPSEPPAAAYTAHPIIQRRFHGDVLTPNVFDFKAEQFPLFLTKAFEASAECGALIIDGLHFCL